MMKQYVTFGQAHRHVIDGKVFDKDCVAVFEAVDGDEGRAMAFQYFGPKFCFHSIQQPRMAFFPRGEIEI
jgi:hypothetical protein